MKVLKFKEYTKFDTMAEELIEMLSNPPINEDKNQDSGWKQILNKVFSDLGLNFALITTFGTGIAAMFPIVVELIENNNLNLDSTKENMLLLTITAVAITYLEERKNKTTKVQIDMSDQEIKENAQSLLAELKLRGIGNGIVKKVVKSFQAIGNLIKIVFKNVNNVINGFVDMFAYTSLLLPCMNVLASFIDKYSLNLDTLQGNFLSIGVGVLTIIAKNGIDYMIKKLGDKFNLKKDKIMQDLDESPIKKYPHPSFVDVEGENPESELIKGNDQTKEI
jgi:hypothetical protein